MSAFESIGALLLVICGMGVCGCFIGVLGIDDYGGRIASLLIGIVFGAAFWWVLTALRALAPQLLA